MGAFLLIARVGNDDRAASRSADLRALATENGLAVSDLNRQAWLAVRGPHPPPRRQVGSWLLIGDVFDRRSPRLPSVRPDDPFAWERKLLSRIWGRYVGVRFGPGDQPEALLRDPSGAMECIAWTDDGLTVVCSAVEDWLLARLKPGWRIDPEKVGSALLDPVVATGPLLLDGPTALQPGALQPLPLDRAPITLWEPRAFAQLSLGDPPSAQDASAALRDAVDEATRGLGGLEGPLAAEVSGGLDSSLIAASLVHGGCDVGLWLNAYGATAESDERSYVMALANTLRIQPTMAPLAVKTLSTTWLEEMSPDFRPGLNALDRAHDEDWGRRLREAGMTALMTGRGGDSILFNRASGDVFTDEWRRSPWRALWSRDMAELATSNEVSMWTLMSRARAHARTGPRLPRRAHPMLPVGDNVGAVHPWLRELDMFGPAKATHIAGVVDNVGRQGPSTLTDVVDVRNPLCAQPVIEACLALPASCLTLRGRERGLARHAFSDRLPARIIDRRSKGDMTKIYGRLVLDGLPVLRPWLIEGRLAAMGLLDPVAADACLTRESLAWQGQYGVVMVAAAFESWVRTWERRLSPDRPPRP